MNNKIDKNGNLITIKIITILLIFFVIGILIVDNLCKSSKISNDIDNKEIHQILNVKQNALKDSAPQIQMYYYIKQYAKEYDVPENILFSIANIETGYRGPMHATYKHNLSSSVAHGPMQITNSTANMMNGKRISTHELKNDIEKNVQLSAKLLSHLHKTYGSWGKAISAYNTGSPSYTNGSYTQNVKHNSYSNNIKSKWVK